LTYARSAEETRRAEEDQAQSEGAERQRERDQFREAIQNYVEQRTREIGRVDPCTRASLEREGIARLLGEVRREADNWSAAAVEHSARKAHMAALEPVPPVPGGPYPPTDEQARRIREAYAKAEARIAQFQTKTGFPTPEAWVEHMESIAAEVERTLRRFERVDHTGASLAGGRDPRRRGPRPRLIKGLTPEESDSKCLEIWKRYSTGHTIAQLAERYGQPERSIRRWRDWGQQIALQRGLV